MSPPLARAASGEELGSQHPLAVQEPMHQKCPFGELLQNIPAAPSISLHSTPPHTHTHSLGALCPFGEALQKQNWLQDLAEPQQEMRRNQFSNPH